MNASSNRPRPTQRAFSLLELLVVIGIIAIMMSLLIPAVGGFSSTAGRRGAVNIVMNTLEQARVAALESGQTVYVGFADNDFPVEDMRYAAFIVFRDATDEEKAQNANRLYVVLKKWTKLPKNIALKSDIASSLIKPANKRLFDVKLRNELGSSLNDIEFPVIAFNSSGSVDSPSDNLRLYLYEGYFAGDQDKPTKNQGSGLFEQISIARYTGRVQLDITGT